MFKIDKFILHVYFNHYNDLIYNFSQLFYKRYALICKSCHFHNGMALKEEFEFVGKLIYY